ncbi:MAG: carboxypeptidase regulatory-like domain-containing protein [Acidobacteriota bacterium]|nr:carboxypeptidase regulatory-like domain-containing protein [Acidobacteriota bacterium]
MPRLSILAALAAVVVAGPAFAQNEPAQVKGAVVDEDGKPVAGARILYVRNPKLVKAADGKWREAPGEMPLSSQTVSDAAGKYQILHLPSGDYRLCMSAPGYLTTCEWTGWHGVTVAPAQALDHGTVQLAKAATVTIRINDPNRLMGSANQITAPLTAGVREASGRFHPAREVASDSTGHTLQVAVPYATPLKLWVHSWRFRLTDAIGAAVDRFGGEFPFQLTPNTAAAQSYTFDIAGEAGK